MVNLLKPSVFLMDNLKYRKKFALIGGLFTLLLGFVLFLLFEEIGHTIGFAEKEIAGNAFLRPLGTLLDDLQRSRRPSPRGSGEIRGAAAPDDRVLGIRNSIRLVDRLDANLGSALDASSRWLSLKNKLFVLQGELDPNGPEGFRRHTELIRELLALMAHVGDRSNLILDPDLDSYYLMFSVVTVLPNLVEDLGQAAGCGRGLSDWRSFTEQDQYRLSNLAGMIKTNESALERSLSVVFRENPSLQPRLKESLQKQAADVDLFLRLLRSLASGHDPVAVGKEFWAKGASASVSTFDLYSLVSRSLDDVLQARISRVSKKRTLIGLTSAATVLVVLYLFAGFYQSVLRTVSNLEAVAQRLERGQMDAAEPLAVTRDELGQITRAFGSLAHRLRQEWTQAKAEAARALSAEASLRESEERSRLIIDTALDAVITMDQEGAIHGWNAQAEIIFGWRWEEVAGQTLSDLIVPIQYREAHGKGLARFLKTGEGRVSGKRIEITALRRDGQEFPVELAIAPVKKSDGFVFSAFIRDVTERKQAEAALCQAKEAAEAAARTKSDFLATMSHEIRTPMNGVIGMTGLLLDTALSAEQREYAETVRNSADSLLVIINDILDFSKIEAGKLSIEPIPFDLEAVAAEVTDLLGKRAEDKGLELILGYSPQVPRRFIGDAGRIRQILLNLVGNAVKFTSKGHVLIEVECAPAPEPTAALRISIRDTGIGIPLDRQPLLFQKFCQADASTTRKFGGTGLGLAISKRLVELMDGDIGLESKQGQGSTFWFTLRLPLDLSSPQDPPVRVELAGVRMLAVDDNQVNRRILAEHLTGWKVRQETISNAAEALEKLRTAQAQGDPFRVAVLDLHMPFIDGEALARTIKADPLLGDTALVLLSSSGQRGEAHRMREAGFSAYLVKPVKASHLHDCLAVLCGAQSQSASSKFVTRHTLAESQDSSERQGLPSGGRSASCNANAGSTHPTTGPAGAPESMTARVSAVRILLAEDNAANQRVAVRMLEKLGYRVDIASNGQEAVDLWSQLPYDLVLMDCQMPEMDGYEATAEIRRRETSPRHTPIVAMTANAMQGDRQKCLDCGMDDFVSKPVEFERLRAAVDRWVRQPANSPITS